MLYGAFVTATMVPILAELALHRGGWAVVRRYGACQVARRLPLPHCCCRPLPTTPAGPGYRPEVVTAFYLPYLLVPLMLALHMAATPQPFGRGGAAKPKRL